MSLDGTVLADRYTVTYTSSLELLTRVRPDSDHAMAVDLLFVAAQMAADSSASPVPSLATQVEQIADETGTGRILAGAEATVAEVAP